MIDSLPLSIRRLEDGGGGGGPYYNPVYSQTPLPTGAGVTPTPVPSPTPAPTPAPAPTPGATGTGTAAPPSALGAFQTFYNSPTYQFPLQQGLKAVNTKYAGMGALESGAAMKAINDYAAGNASSALGTYMDQLYRQEALGMSASSALAGVGQNLVSQVSANNSNAASAAGNAILVNGQANANNINNVGGAISGAVGQIAGALGTMNTGSIPAPNLSAPMTVNTGANLTPPSSLPSFF